MKDGFIKVAAATPRVKIGDTKENARRIEELILEAADEKCGVISFPELALTAYTCGDLFRSKLLLSSAEESLKELMERTMDRDILCSVGLPVAHNGALYNCAAVFHRGKLLGLSAKTNIPNYSEFYEARHFAPACEAEEISFSGQRCFLGKGLVYDCENVEGLSVGVEICEDLWVAEPPSIGLAKSGATLILNSSCSDEVVGKREYRRSLVSIHSGHLVSAYVYASSGEGESTTDMVFAGHNLIAENGSILGESELFTTGLTTAEIDLERLTQERLRMNTISGESPKCCGGVKHISFEYKKETLEAYQPSRVFSTHPFVPEGAELAERGKLILSMQAHGLAGRLRHIGCKAATIAVSGGLDSALALIVTAKAFDLLGLDRKGIKAISMPCFGTTERTYENAVKLIEGIGAEYIEIPVEKAVLQHFEDIGQDKDNYDITFENAQARERTQVLMDMANKVNGIVIGTGDLSELALGWATYNGDHMSMYGVNASVPKTLVRHLVAYEAENSEGKLKEALLDILGTPVSPELLPPKDGEISQKTEHIVGPYELHDFFLYYMLRFGFTPAKIFRMAEKSFAGEYDRDEIKKWLTLFYKRFFSQQFKRSCLPDGPKVGSVTLSPRGDYRMPSDASARLWLDEIEKL